MTGLVRESLRTGEGHEQLTAKFNELPAILYVPVQDLESFVSNEVSADLAQLKKLYWDVDCKAIYGNVPKAPFVCFGPNDAPCNMRRPCCPVWQFVLLYQEGKVGP